MKKIFVLLAAILLFGCYSRKKAQTQFGKAAITYPEIGAEFCAKTYPVIAKTDSVAYKDSKRIIDSLAQSLRNDSLLSQQEKERLLLAIDKIKESIPAPENCDSLFDAIYRLAAQQMARADKLQILNSQLVQAANNLKPIHDTVINTAALDLCSIERGKAIRLVDEKTIESNKWKDKAKKRFWIIVGLGALIAIYTGFKIYKAIKPIAK